MSSPISSQRNPASYTLADEIMPSINDFVQQNGQDDILIVTHSLL